MKSSGFILLVPGALLLSAVCHGQAVPARVSGTGLAMMPPNVSNPTAEAIGDEELLRLRGASSAQPFFSKPIPARESDLSLAALSCFLEYGGSHTMLPKGCIVNLPAELKNRQVDLPAGKLIPWTGFLENNRNWIRCIEVSTDQILGHAKIPDEALEPYRKAKMLVIACHAGNPVTVLTPPPKPPEP